MEFQKSVIELIETRKSSRTYQDGEIVPETWQKLKDYVDLINQDVNIKARFILASRRVKGEDQAIKLGTYGIIAGANQFIIGILDRDEKKANAFGYLFEKIILKATDLGLQTCWLGGTFKKKDFNQISHLHENEYIAIVSPVGYSKRKQRILESAMRAFAGSNHRKPWSELFFEGAAEVPLKDASAGAYLLPLAMLRLSPSASNKQPWRVIKDKNAYHFFLCRTKGYWVTYFDMQENDIGIARCHFELTASELGLKGMWQSVKTVEHPQHWEYITSWIMK